MAQYTVSLRGGFADRNKIKEENTTMQFSSLDERTRVALMNITDIVIHGYFPDIDYSQFDSRYQDEQNFMKSILADVYSRVVNWSRKINYSDIIQIIKDTFATDDYASVLTVIEYICQTVQKRTGYKVYYKGKSFTAEQLYNLILKQEYVGYRLLNGRAMPITDDQEIAEIKEVSFSKYAEVKQHINKALGFLSDRQSPDYANSIKESISAVERMCSIIIGKPTTLGDALKKLEDSGVVIHPALKSAFIKLYGYTSDASGIRHSGELGGKESTFEEAKFMLVSCCAFVNYLTGLLAKCP